MKACIPKRPPKPVNKRLLAKYTMLANTHAARLKAQPLMKASKAMKAPTYTASSSKKRLMWILFRYLAGMAAQSRALETAAITPCKGVNAASKRTEENDRQINTASNKNCLSGSW